MRLIIFITLLVCALGYPRTSCLKSNDICNATDISVDDYTLCGNAGDSGAYPIDTSTLPAQGSGKMRSPDECEGLCVDILSTADKNKFVCSNAVQLTSADCVQFRNARHCVADSGSILAWVGIGIVLLGLCTCCLVYNPNGENKK